MLNLTPYIINKYYNNNEINHRGKKYNIAVIIIRQNKLFFNKLFKIIIQHFADSIKSW